MEQEQNKAEIVEEMPKTDALFDEKGQANLVKEALESEERSEKLLKKRVMYFCLFCIVVIVILYFSYLK